MKDAEQEAIDAVKNGLMTTGNYTLQAQMPMGKAITVSGYIYSNSTVKSISEQIDMMCDVIDRQRARAEIPELEVKLEQKFAALRNHKEHLESLLKNRDSAMNSEKKSSLQKKQLDDSQAQIDNFITTISKMEEDIDKGMKAIEDAKKKAM